MALKVAVISPTSITTPPKDYGGIERLVYLLIKQLEKHYTITLYAAEGSYKPNGGLHASKSDMELAVMLLDNIDGYDVVVDWSHQKLLSQILELHGRGVKPPNILNMVFWTDMLGIGYNVFPCKAVKNAFMQLYKHLTSRETAIIPPGIDVERYPVRKNKDNYFLYFGRIIPEKGVLELIKIAKTLGIELIVAGHTGPFSYDRKYLETVKMECTGKVRFIGDVEEKDKIDLISNAAAVMHRPNWLESFWIVGCEAMACGTPLIVSTDSGGPVEQVIYGKTGFICSTLEEWKNAASMVSSINPEDCVRRAQYFSDKRMGFDWQNFISSVARVIT